MQRSEILLWTVLAVTFGPALFALAEVWSQVDYYSHGFLVPLVAAGIAMGQRHRLSKIPPMRDRRGGWVVLCAGALYLAGLVIDDASLQGLGFIAALAGGVWLLRGMRWLKALGPGIAYLLFMVPIPEPWLTPVIVQLQLFVTKAGIAILQTAGISVLRDGNVIQLPGGESLFVAEACSGITSIVTLLPLAVFLAYFTQPTIGRRLVLVFAVIPFAMLGNLLRVTGTVVAVRRFGIDSATGAIHDSAGILTYVLGCAALLGLGALIRRIMPEPSRQVSVHHP